MPNTGTPAVSTPSIASTAYPAAAGSPGPLEKKTPSGPVARICAVVDVAGSTCTRQPRAAIAAGVAALMPRSTAATRYRAWTPGGGPTWYGSAVDTSRARSAPAIRGPGGAGGADRGPHHAVVAQPPGERPGSGDRDAGDALGGQFLVQAALR